MILTGIDVANHLFEQMTKKIVLLQDNAITPTLGIVRVGVREDDLSYERSIIKKFEKLGMEVEIFSFEESISNEEVIQQINQLNQASNIHGILLFRPLPKHLDENTIRNSICLRKDVDCASDSSLSSIFLGNGKKLPCTAGAVMEMLKYYAIPISSKNVIIIGRSMVVGRPLAIRLLQENATITIAHSKTTDMAKFCKDADIIVVATGQVNTLTEDMVGEKAIVIDVGINFVDGKIVGDIDFAKVSKKVKAISPVPRGVGSITTSVLAMQVVDVAMESIHHLE